LKATIWFNWEEHTGTLRKLPKTGWRGSKYIKFENLTPYFELIKTISKENSILSR
jgi:hypothetical protein